MHAMRVIALALMLTAFTAALASAHPAASRVDRRQAAQQSRIQHGARHGELTRGELRRLRAGQRHVRRAERMAKSDGVVTPRERAYLERLQDRQSRRIARFRGHGRD